MRERVGAVDPPGVRTAPVPRPADGDLLNDTLVAAAVGVTALC